MAGPHQVYGLTQTRLASTTILYMDVCSTIEKGVAGVKLLGPGLKGAREKFALTWSNLKIEL